MLLKSSNLVILCLLVASSISVEGRRRSRIDLPAKNASESTTEENLTTLAEKIEAEKLEAPAPTTIQSDILAEEKPGESNSSEESPAYEDCDLDNISFEMITG